MKSVFAAIAAGLLASAALAQPAPAPAPKVTYIQAGALLAKPGEPPRGASTIIVRGDKIDEVRDGFVEAEAGARVVDLRCRA
jgi:hypothetical protein